MKKYLISGFNTVQDVKLEAGTYTLVAYAKSMYSNVYTFALGDGENWTEYDIDVVQGQLCKVWLTFTIDKKATKFKPIANNFSESLPVYVTDLQLTKGNIPVEAGASPFDIDQILNDLHDGIDAIEDFTEGAFLDGLLSREEKTQLRASLDSIGAIVESVKGSYNKLLDNPFIHENTMDSITARYYAFIASWISDGDPRGLKPVILWIVNGDNIVSPNEREEKDRALNAFNDALYAYNQAEKEVYNDVGENSIAPIITEDGFWAFWDKELQEFVPSEFSAEGDDGHSPYIDVLTGTWWEWNPNLWNSVTNKYGDYWDTEIKAEGDSGEDGITISPNQQGYTYRADLNGDIIGSLANGMVELTITSGSTPITCSSATSGGTPTTNGTYRVTRTLGNGITTNSSLSGGKYRITPATLTVDEASVELEIKIMMDGVVTSYPLTLTYRKQFDGADGKSTEFIFKGSTSDTTAPTLPSTSQQDDWYGQGTSYEWNDDLIEPTKTLPYVWASQRKKVDGVWGAFTTPKVWLRYAEDAKSLILSASSFAMACYSTNVAKTGQTITINAKLQNITGTASFDATPYNASGTALTKITLGGSGNTRTLTSSQWLSTFQKVVITATLSGLSDTVTITRLPDGEDGEDAPLLYLSPSSQVMVCDSDNNSKPNQNIEVKAKLQNVTGTATFTASPYNDNGIALANITLGGSGNLRTLKSNQWLSTFNKVEVTAMLGDLSDTVTIHRLADAEDSITGYLTNENITLQASSTGVVSSFANAIGVFKVHDGELVVSSGVDYSSVSQSGCTVSIDALGAYKVLTMPADDAIAKFKAVYKNVEIIRELKLSKSKQGDEGEDGKDGISASLTNDNITIKVDSLGNPISLDSAKGKYIVYSGDFDVSDSSTFYPPTTVGCTISMSQWGEFEITAIDSTKTSIYADFSATYSGTTITKRLTISIVKDGDKGADGLPPEIDTTITQYALGESKTEHPAEEGQVWAPSRIIDGQTFPAGYIDIWQDDRRHLVPNEATPYEWSRQRITYKDSTQVMYVGYVLMTNISPASYMFGEWACNIKYVRDEKAYPIVTYLKKAEGKPLYYYPKKEGVIEYPQFSGSVLYKKGDIVWYENTSPSYNTPLGLYRAKLDSNSSYYSPDQSSWWENVTSLYAPNGIEGQKLWEFADGVELVITDALMANFGKIASAVFSGDHMISQFGEDQSGNQVSDYKNFGKVDENENPLFTPNIDIDFFKGLLKALDVEIRGSFESNSSGNRIRIDPSSRRMIFTTHDDFGSGSIGFDAEGALLNLYKRFSASMVYSSSVKLDGYSFLLRKYGQSGNETNRVTISPTGVEVSNDSNTTEVLDDGVYVNGVKQGTGGGSSYTHPSSHPADMISAGTFAGIVKANNNTSYTTKQVRNMILSTNNAISSQMANGDIWIKYE